jgi:hypothetical protein
MMPKDRKPCLFASVGCKKGARAKGMCDAHYTAVFVRKTPIEQVMKTSMHRLEDGDTVHVTSRISTKAKAKADAAIKAGKARTMYQVISLVMERWDGTL